MRNFVQILATILCLCPVVKAANFYVATNGNDTWSGKLPAPNKRKTDGPFATLSHARDVLRGVRAEGQKIVYARGGTYYLAEPLALTPADSGLSFLAYAGERPVLSGGRPITGWQKGDGHLWTASVPQATGGAWDFRMLRVGDEAQTLARYPNFDPRNPYKGGWSSVVYTGPKVGAFGAAVGRIHTPGDWMEWKVDVPAEGDYKVWFYYAAQNKPYGYADLAGRQSLQVDGGASVKLQNLPDTGAFGTFKWSDVATLHLTPGNHTLRWTNVQGGGINFDAFALADDPAWIPAGTKLAAPATGKHTLVVQAETYSAAQGKEMTTPEENAPAYTDHFQFRPGDIKAYPRSPHPEIHIFPAWGWVNTILYVTHIDPATHTVYVEQNSNASEELRTGNRYYISNALEELDEPGEWYLDSESGTLYLWPKTADFQQRPIVAPVLDRIFDLHGDPAQNQWVENITIKGFELRDTSYSRNIGVYEPHVLPSGSLARATVWSRATALSVSVAMRPVWRIAAPVTNL